MKNSVWPDSLLTKTEAEDLSVRALERLLALSVKPGDPAMVFRHFLKEELTKLSTSRE